MRVATAGLLTAFVVGFLFALPSPFAGIPMPAKLLWHVLPAFRVPSRWDPLLMTTLLPLAALGLQTVWRTIALRRVAAAVAVVAAAIAVSVVELATQRPHHFRTVPVPAEYAALKSKAPAGILAEYPLGYSDIYRLWQRVHGRPLVNGAPEGSTSDQARLMLLDPAKPGTAQSLSLLGVTAIAIHPQAHVDTPVEPRQPTGAEGYRLIGRYPDGTSLWDVTARAAPAFVTLPGGFASPRRVAGGGGIGYPLISSSGVALLEIRAKAAGVIRLIFDATVPGGGTRQFRIQDATGEHPLTLRRSTHFELNVEVPRGISQLLVKTDPPATSEGHAVVLSQPRAERASGAPFLHAGPSSAQPGF
jgi:hypothetical protein